MLLNSSYQEFFFIIDNTNFPNPSPSSKNEIELELTYITTYASNDIYYIDIMIFGFLAMILIIVLMIFIYKYKQHKKEYSDLVDEKWKLKQ
jgi:heme/copper-type cytochrome/quinol oxidase subunit 2